MGWWVSGRSFQDIQKGETVQIHVCNFGALLDGSLCSYQPHERKLFLPSSFWNRIIHTRNSGEVDTRSLHRWSAPIPKGIVCFAHIFYTLRIDCWIPLLFKEGVEDEVLGRIDGHFSYLCVFAHRLEDLPPNLWREDCSGQHFRLAGWAPLQRHWFLQSK